MKRAKKFFVILMIMVMAISSSPINIATELNQIAPFSVVAQAAKAKTHLNKTKKSIYIGKKFTLKLLDKKGKTISATKVKWKSSNKKIASVNKKGVVTGKKAGKAKITATYKGKKYVSTITVKSTVSVNKSKLTFSAGSTKRKAVIITFKENCSIWSEIVEGSEIIDTEWSKKWDGDTTKLYIYPTGDGFGKARVKIYSDDHPESYAYVDVKVNGKESNSNSETTTIPETNIDTENSMSNLDCMAACGLNHAYASAKYPSTLHLNSITYVKGDTNGYGDVIDRMVLRCYATNGFGGYGDIYVVVLRCDSGENYPRSKYYEGYGYITVSAFDSEPGLERKTFDNKRALEAYQNLFNTDRVIPYD